MTQIEQILAEIGNRIERLKDLMECSISDNRQVSIYEGKIETLSMFREYISSFPKQIISQPVSEDLRKAEIDWLRPQLDKSYANYGETKMMELTRFDGFAMLDAIEFGAQWQKEQLIKGAVEGVVIKPDYEAKGTTKSTRFQVDDDVISTIYDKGDKVKLIILKD